MTAKTNKITLSVTINNIYDTDLYLYFATIDSRRRGFMMVELCKKGLALDNSMWKQTVDLTGGMGNAPQQESPEESPVESLDTSKYRVNYED